MKKIQILVLNFVILIQLSCSSSKSTTDSKVAEAPVPDGQMLPVAQKKYPGINLESLTEGHRIYTNECTNCHGIKSVKSEPESEWISIIDRMAPKANLNPDQKKKVLEYVLSSRAFVTQ